MNLAHADSVIRSYDWQCNDHKTCIVCEKGDDVRTRIVLVFLANLTGRTETYAYMRLL